MEQRVRASSIDNNHLSIDVVLISPECESYRFLVKNFKDLQ